MKTSSRNLVHRLVAAHAQIGLLQVDDTHTFDGLGLDPLDLVLIVVQLGSLEAWQEDFPLHTLDRARTVGDLVELVDAQRERASAASLAFGRAS